MEGKIWGVIAPHAGYRYSGAVAAQAFAALKGLRPDVIVLLGPYHDSHPAPFLTTAHAAYCTPLGNVELHLDFVESLDDHLRQAMGTGLVRLKRDGEHSLEIQLPFLQTVCGEFRLLPIMLRERRPSVLRELGEQLAKTVSGSEVIFVASSDLSHFFSQERARQLDAEMLRRMAAFDADGILAAEAEGAGYACGAGAIAACLWAARAMGADRVTVAGYATSGDVSGDFSSVVGYGSALIWQAQGRGD
jgi:AmmeMemoRadiSam system protein B